MNPENPFQPQQPPTQPQQTPPMSGGQFQQPSPTQPIQPVQSAQPMGQPLATAPANTSNNFTFNKPSKKWFIIAIVGIITTLIVAGLAIWAFMNYIDQRDNVNSKVDSAVAVAVKDQADKDAAAFLEKEKQPNRQFAGPDDYGRPSFDYPKTWSVYIARDAANGGTYEAYFNPAEVPPVSNSQQYALRLIIEEKDYDRVIDSYKNLVSRGDLKSSSVKADDQNGTRLDGAFTKDIKGSAVVFKIRDKTVTIRTDAEAFKGDFDALIKTITFNK